MPHGQLIVGPPGSGKTTYALITQNILNQLSRNVVYINLDPANESLPNVSSNIRNQFIDEIGKQEKFKLSKNIKSKNGNYFDPMQNFDLYGPDFQIDIMDVCCLEKIQKEFNLGPNGGLIYALNWIKNFGLSWIKEQVDKLKRKYGLSTLYFLIDCPGQIEIVTSESHALKGIISFFQNDLNTQLCVVNLVDGQYCAEPSKYIGALLTCLNTEISLELPHINVMSKMDLIQLTDNLDDSKTKLGRLSFRLSEYLSFGNIAMLVKQMPQESRFTKLNKALVELLENWNHVSFLPLNIQNKSSIVNILRQVDKANGYAFIGDLQNVVYNNALEEKLAEFEQDDDLF